MQAVFFSDEQINAVTHYIYPKQIQYQPKDNAALALKYRQTDGPAAPQAQHEVRHFFSHVNWLDMPLANTSFENAVPKRERPSRPV
jgi:hypothetical protein